MARVIPILWAPLTDEQRELLSGHITIRKCLRDEILFAEGDTPQFLFYLLRGKITMKRQGIGDQHVIVRMVEPGALFGFAAAFEGVPLKSTAIAGENSVVVKVPMTLVFHLIWENSNFAMLFIKELSALLGLSISHTITLTQKHMRGRLAEVLLRLRDKYGVEDDGETLSVYLSRDDLGKMSNMTTSNAIRTLSAFVSEGLLAFSGRRIRFLNIDELARISRMG